MTRIVCGLAAFVDAVMLAVHLSLEPDGTVVTSAFVLLIALCLGALVPRWSTYPRLAAAVGNLALGVVSLASIGFPLVVVGVVLLLVR